MTLPSSPPITAMDIFNELKIANPNRQLPFTLLDPDALALAGKSGPPIMMSDFLGKSVFAPGLTGANTTYARSDSGGTITVTLTVRPDGSMTVTNAGGGTDPLAWGSPITAGIGAGYYVRFTLTNSSSSGTGTGGASASTGWLLLDLNRTVQASATKTGSTGGSRIVSGTYTVEISQDQSTIIATGTGYLLRATAEPL